MGSPLAPLFAEIFLQDFEKKHLPSIKSMGIIHWKRYVDDTFVLVDPELDIKNILPTLSSFHPCVQFTHEEEYLPENKNASEPQDTIQPNRVAESTTESEATTASEQPAQNNNVLSFLDVLVERHHDSEVGFQTKIYRKSTFTGLITKWDSFVPRSYKYSAISSMIYRAIKICSTKPALDAEFNFIRQIALKNGYPIAFVNSIIGKQISLLNEPPVAEPTTLETDTVVLRVPYYGEPSEIFGKRVVAAVAKQYPLKKVRVVYDLTSRIGQYFNTKDPIPTDLRSGIIYEAICSQCNVNYIGKTYRHLQTRVNEHLAELRRFVFSPVQPSSTTPPDATPSVTTTTTNKFHMATRSKSRMLAQTQNPRRASSKPVPPSTNSQPLIPSLLTTSTRMKPTLVKPSRKKTITVSNNLPENDMKDLLSQTTPVESVKLPFVPKSAITRHYLKTGHIITKKDFRILLPDAHRYRLLIKESLLIRQNNPILNGTDRSIPLFVFSEGNPYRQINSKNKPPPGLEWYQKTSESPMFSTLDNISRTTHNLPPATTDRLHPIPLSK